MIRQLPAEKVVRRLNRGPIFTSVLFYSQSRVPVTQKSVINLSLRSRMPDTFLRAAFSQ